MTSHPLPGADALVLAVGGIRQHPVILIDDRRYRVRELAEGEVCLYTDEDLLDAKQPDESNEDQDPALPHRIVLKRGRIIEMRCGASSIVMSPSGIELRVTDGTTTSLLTLTATDIDVQAGDGAHVLLDTNVDIDGGQIDLN